MGNCKSDSARRFSIGVDFGTLSARAVLLDLKSGAQVSVGEAAYPHGVMEQSLPDGQPLCGDGWALQVPQDYMDALYGCVRRLMEDGRVRPEEVVGIGVDFTSCTVLPTDRELIPLCERECYRDRPHAYCKLWKHHRAAQYADALNSAAKAQGKQWIDRYGGNISGEWLIPKAMELLAEAPDVFSAADRFIEAGDWVVSRLCGAERRSVCNAGYKAAWSEADGYPDSAFLDSLMPGLGVLADKLGEKLLPVGSKAGELCPDMAERLGLRPGTAVSAGIIDAHASLPGCGVAEAGTMLMIMGTSTCHMLLSERQAFVPGICGYVRDGILPGFYGYEAGQSCVGDHFAWFMENCFPAKYDREANDRGISPYRLMQEKIEKLPPGSGGLIALDWWGGVRSVLMDFTLTGLMAGFTVGTKPEQIYKALIEATAFGTKMILDTFEAGGLAVDKICAAGGIAHKDPAVMQIYADVCGRPVEVCGGSQSGARGSAILAAAAAGPELSGFPDAVTAVKKLGKRGGKIFHPDFTYAEQYKKLYEDYCLLYNEFGSNRNSLLRRRSF